MPAFSARNARINYDGSNLLGLKWSINVKVDEIDVSNFEGLGYVDYIGGLWEADISFDAIHPGGAAVSYTNLYPGAIVPATFYLDSGSAIHVRTVAGIATASNRSFSFGNMLLTSVSIEAETRSFIRFSATAKNCGLFTWPGV